MANATPKERTNGRPGPAAGETRTQTEQAYDRIRQDIIGGVLRPLNKLQTEALKSRYGFGNSSLREALMRLTSEELVTFEGQRGFRVAAASREDFADLCGVRKIIEVEAVRQSVTNGDDVWESNVVASYYRLSKVEEQMPERLEQVYEQWEDRNREFHRALISACPSRWLSRIHDQLLHQAERYRRITFMSGRRVSRNVQDEHRAIMEAALARDVDAACGLSASHIQRTLTVFYRLKHSEDGGA